MNELKLDPRFAELFQYARESGIPTQLVGELFIANNAVAQHEEIDILAFWSMMRLMAQACVTVVMTDPEVDNDPE